jgi:YfiH family protein
MTDVDPPVTIGDEKALDFRARGARMFFAFGPPTPSCPPEQRMHELLAALEPEITAIRWGEQIHGRVVASLAAETGQPFENAICVGRCDAQITAERGVGLVVWTADCVPILISGGDVVASVHSGWRGSVADIVGAVVRRFSVEYGVPPEDLRAVLGPAISGPRYEVSDEVIDGLGQLDIPEGRWRSGNHVDLRAFLTARLEDLGLDPAEIVSVGPCTASTPDLASYRRDGTNAGRQWSMIYRPSESY